MHPTLKQLETLPPMLQQQIITLIQSLLKQYKQTAAQPLKQTWAGTMSAYRDQYTALSLQQETVDAWGTHVSD